MLYYKRNDCYIHRKIFDDDFLVPVGQQVISRNGIVMLNETAAFLWDEVGEEKTAGELCAALAENFEVNDENVSGDVLRFIETMLSLGAVIAVEHE